MNTVMVAFALIMLVMAMQSMGAADRLHSQERISTPLAYLGNVFGAALLALCGVLSSVWMLLESDQPGTGEVIVRVVLSALIVVIALVQMVTTNKKIRVRETQRHGDDVLGRPASATSPASRDLDQSRVRRG